MSDTLNDSLLDDTIDDLADLPSNAPFPAGVHRATCFVTRNKEKPSNYIVRFKYGEPIELTDPSATPPNPGDEATVFIHTKKKDGTPNTIGQGQLKIIAKPLSTLLNATTMTEVVDGTKSGIDVIIVTKIRKSKDAQYDDAMEVTALEIAS